MSEAALRYEEPTLYSVDELRRIASSGDGNAVMSAVVGVAVNPENELEAVQEALLGMLDHPDLDVRQTVVASLGEATRVHGRRGRRDVVPVLRALRRDPLVGGYADQALSDISIFTRGRVRTALVHLRLWVVGWIPDAQDLREWRAAAQARLHRTRPVDRP